MDWTTGGCRLRQQEEEEEGSRRLLLLSSFYSSIFLVLIDDPRRQGKARRGDHPPFPTSTSTSTSTTTTSSRPALFLCGCSFFSTQLNSELSLSLVPLCLLALLRIQETARRHGIMHCMLHLGPWVGYRSSSSLALRLERECLCGVCPSGACKAKQCTARQVRSGPAGSGRQAGTGRRGEERREMDRQPCMHSCIRRRLAWVRWSTPMSNHVRTRLTTYSTIHCSLLVHH